MELKTVHNSLTVHGFETIHKNLNEYDNELNVLSGLSTQLYPTGRAFYKPEDSVFFNFTEAINTSFSRLIKDSESLLNSIFPDNDNFTDEDILIWEYRLGLISNLNTDSELRKQAIKRKLGHPNNIKERQDAKFIQYQLNLAGFDVFVHENTFPYKNPQEIANLSINEKQHSENVQHGNGVQHGGDGFSLIANSTQEIESYSVNSSSLWATFFIGGEVLGNIASVPQNRLKEFKELVIKLKPAHTVAFTFINYI